MKYRYGTSEKGESKQVTAKQLASIIKRDVEVGKWNHYNGGTDGSSPANCSYEQKGFCHHIKLFMKGKEVEFTELEQLISSFIEVVPRKFFKKQNGVDNMQDISKFLSPTEKLTSEIIDMSSRSFGEVISRILSLKRKCTGKNEKIVRILVENDGNIIKLQSYDNGTPYVLVCNKRTFSPSGMKMLCRQEKWVLSII